MRKCSTGDVDAICSSGLGRRPPLRDTQITLGDGRTLAYCDIGEPGWPTAMFFHGAPMSRLHLAYLEEKFVERQVRVVSPDRPGYGRSSLQPVRSLADWPANIEALA